MNKLHSDYCEGDKGGAFGIKERGGLLNHSKYHGEGGNWIAGAIKHPGALHKEMGVPSGKKIPTSNLKKAEKKGGKLGQRARLAETLKSLHHGMQMGASGLGLSHGLSHDYEKDEERNTDVSHEYKR